MSAVVQTYILLRALALNALKCLIFPIKTGTIFIQCYILGSFDTLIMKFLFKTKKYNVNTYLNLHVPI